MHRLDAPTREICERNAHGDPVEPGAERRLAAESRHRSKDLHESFLQQIFHVGVRAEDSEENGVDSTPLAQKKLALRVPIARDTTAREVNVLPDASVIRPDHVLIVPSRVRKVTFVIVSGRHCPTRRLL